MGISRSTNENNTWMISRYGCGTKASVSSLLEQPKSVLPPTGGMNRFERTSTSGSANNNAGSVHLSELPAPQFPLRSLTPAVQSPILSDSQIRTLANADLHDRIVIWKIHKNRRIDEVSVRILQDRRMITGKTEEAPLFAATREDPPLTSEEKRVEVSALDGDDTIAVEVLQGEILD